MAPVVGLAEEGCICSEEGRPEGWSDSLSGRYLADENYGLPMSKLEKLPFSNGSTVWDWLLAKRKQGTRAFLSDLALNIPEGNRVAYNKHEGFIGDVKEWSYPLVNLNGFTGVGLHPKMFRGVQMKIRGFRLYYPGLTDGTVNVYLSTALLQGDTDPAYSIAFTGNTGNVIHVLVPTASPIEIDLADTYGQPVSVFAMVENGGNMPMNTRFFCSTCGVPAWGKFFTPQNISVAAIDDLIPICQGRFVQYGSANHGIAIDLSVECSDSWMCGSMNYTAHWPRVMSEALQLFQQREAMTSILKMEAARPAVIFGREELKKQVENINALLPGRMTYLGNNIPISLSDCLVCQDQIQVMENLI